MKYNKNYYVPIVVKNRDYLIGWLDSQYIINEILELDFSLLDSMRYTDVLPDGQRRRHLTEEQILDVLKNYYESSNIKENPSENDNHAEVPYLDVTCTCGNYVKFNSSSDISKNSYVCEICGKHMIDYTGHDIGEYDYDGDEEKMTIGLDLDIEITDDDDSTFHDSDFDDSELDTFE